jgi:LytR cell envelope-related transcriptional attenuator
MEHTYAREHPYVRKEAVDTPWRTAAVLAAAVAAIELFILVLIGIVFGAKLLTDSAQQAVVTAKASGRAGTTAAAAPSQSSRGKANSSSSTPTADLARDQTSVVVLNGNGQPGAAAGAASQVRRFHYIIAATGNAPRTNFQRSIVMYRKGYEGEAIRLAHDLHVRRVAPLDGLRPSDFQGAHLALIIGG